MPLVAAAKEKVQSKTEVCRMLKEKIRRCEQSRMSTNNRKADSQKIVTRLQRDLQKVKEELETGTNIDDGKLRGLQESLEVFHSLCVRQIFADIPDYNSAKRSLRRSIQSYHG